MTGIPAAGKSTIAEIIAKKLKLPIISKDTMKELLFDTIKSWHCQHGNYVLY